MRILILGPQGSGKGTQAKRLAAKHALQHVATGDILRTAVADGSELGRRVAPILDAGDLVPDPLMIDLIRRRLELDDGFVLDGFPRTLRQAEALDAMLAEIDRPLDAVIFLRVGDDVAVNRLGDRAAEEGRVDDTPEVIANRLRHYHEDTEPVVERYADAGMLLTVDGERTVDEVAAEIDAALGAVRAASS